METEVREWEYLEAGINCKLLIKAEEYLNGKLIVEIKKATHVKVSVYEMPNYFSDEFDFHGLFENGKEWHEVGEGRYEVPSDWTVFLEYNPKYMAGVFRVNSWVEPYNLESQGDIDFINNM